MLADGRYDAFVVWAEPAGQGAVAVELTIVAGEHKGEVVSVTGTGLADDPFTLVGIPCTLVVESGTPRLEDLGG